MTKDEPQRIGLEPELVAELEATIAALTAAADEITLAGLVRAAGVALGARQAIRLLLTKWPTVVPVAKLGGQP